MELRKVHRGPESSRHATREPDRPRQDQIRPERSRQAQTGPAALPSCTTNDAMEEVVKGRCSTIHFVQIVSSYLHRKTLQPS